MLVAKRAVALLQGTQHDKGQEPLQGDAVSSTSVPADWQVHEAPVTCTLTFACKGIDVPLTMRDVSNTALFARIQRILPKIQEKTQRSPRER
jgi:hypothetical protein